MFCSNCGKQINDGAAFCANCGQKVGVQNNIQPNVINQPVTINQQPAQKKQVQVLDKAKVVFEKIKKFRLPRMNVDYTYKSFKFAMIILMAFELGDFITYLLPLYTNSINRYLSYTIELAVKILLFVVFAAAAFLPLFKKLRATYRQKRSNVIAVLWGTFIIIKIVLVILSAKSKITDCFANPMLVINIVNIALVITTLLYLFKNRPQNILMPIISMLVWQLYADGIGGLSYRKMLVSLATLDYRIGEDTLFGAIFAWNLEVLDFGMFAIPILIILSIIVRYLFSHNTSKGIIISLCSFVFAVNMLDTVLNLSDGFSISYIFDYVDYIIYIFLIVLFALSFVKTKAVRSDEVEQKMPFKAIAKRKLVTGAISVAVSFVLVLGSIITSSAVSASYINKNIKNWVSFVKVGHNATQEQWDKFTSSIMKSDDFLLTNKFVFYDDYKNYQFINENYSTLEDIVICYNAYLDNVLPDEDLTNKYRYITGKIDESWQENQTLNPYYKLYQEVSFWYEFNTLY